MNTSMMFNTEYLYQLVLNRIISLKNLLKEIERSMPRFGPLFFLHAQKIIVEAIYTSFSKHSEAFQNLKERSQESEVRQICLEHILHVQIIHESYLHLVQNIETSFIWPELQKPIAQFVEEFQEKENFALSLRPFWKYNYELLCFIDFVKNHVGVYDPDELNQDLLSQVKHFPKWFVFVFYPYLEHKNALLNTLIAHEIGHFLDYNFNLHGLFLERIKLDKSRTEKLVNKLLKKKEITKGEEEFVKEELRKSVIDTCWPILKSWLKEFISDILAVRFMGPCYFFAMHELTAMTRRTTEIDSYSETHPSRQIRLLKILDELEYLSFFGPKSKYYPLAKDLESIKGEFVSRGSLEPLDEYFNIVYHSLFSSSAFEYLQEDLRKNNNIPASLVYKETRYHNEVSKLLENLLDGVPPSERLIKGNNWPARIPAIMNAGWEIYLDRKKRDSFYQLTSAFSHEEQAKALENFNELLLKAIESTYTLGVWRKWKREWKHKE